jgi:ketosteroid isomerase-like protein
VKLLLFACAVGAAWAGSAAETAKEIIAMERTAMDGFQKGDPGPALAMMDPGITFFHTVTDRKLDGLAAVKALFEPYRGRPLFERYEMVEPKVQVSGDIAVLTYQLVQQNGEVMARWNGTQVYQRRADGWRVIHTHWSQAK